MNNRNIKYVPSWTNKSPCVPTKRSKLTICGERKKNLGAKEVQKVESIRRAESESETSKTGIDLRENPVYSWDDMALRMLAPFPSDSVRYF